MPIDNSFEGIGYTLTSGGGVEVYVAPRNMGGKLAVCGFVLTKNATATTRAIERQGTANIAFWLGEAPLRVRTDLFKRYKSEEDIKASPLAGCGATNVVWDESFAKAKIKMELSNGTIRY